MRDTDNLLIGTSWIRSKGQHHELVGTLDSIREKGPRIKAQSGYYRLAWAELGLTWSPSDGRSERAYELWKLADHINYLDSKVVIAGQQTPIERETYVPTEVNGGAVEIEQTKECHGAWHRHGKFYEQVPLSRFAIATRGPNTGKLASVCMDCTAKHSQHPSVRRQIKYKTVEPIKIEPVIETPEGNTFRWKITVVVYQEHFVQGRDFLDAAAQVSGLGEITKVEKL